MALKNYVITNVNGTDVLFHVPDENYIEGTMWVFVVTNTGTITGLFQPGFFDGGYFSLTTAPTAGSDLFVQYQIPDPDYTFDINGVTIDNILDIVNVIKTQNQTIDQQGVAIDHRVSTTDFTKFAEALDAKLKVLVANQPI